jgi:hypothetical protein
VKLLTKRVNFRSASASWEYEQMYRCTKAEEMPVFFSSFAKVGYDSVCYSLIVLGSSLRTGCGSYLSD